MKGNIQVPKGTRDFTSKVMFRRNYIFKKVRSYDPVFLRNQEKTPYLVNKKIALKAFT